MIKHRCEGRRRGFKRGTWGVHPCGRLAKGTITTNVGFSERHYACGDDECHRSISGGYPSPYKPFAETK